MKEIWRLSGFPHTYCCDLAVKHRTVTCSVFYCIWQKGDIFFDPPFVLMLELKWKLLIYLNWNTAETLHNVT